MYSKNQIGYYFLKIKSNMYKHPLHYKKEDIGEILNVPLTLDIGLLNSNEIEETIEGIIINCTLAANEPHLPASVIVETLKGELRTFSLFEIKRIRSK